MIDTISILILLAIAFTLGAMAGMGLLYHYYKKKIDECSEDIPHRFID